MFSLWRLMVAGATPEGPACDVPGSLGQRRGTMRAVVHAHLRDEMGRGHIRAFRDAEAPRRAGAVTYALFPKTPER